MIRIESLSSDITSANPHGLQNTLYRKSLLIMMHRNELIYAQTVSYSILYVAKALFSCKYLSRSDIFPDVQMPRPKGQGILHDRYFKYAITSTSQSTFLGRVFTATQLLAGGVSVKYFA